MNHQAPSVARGFFSRLLELLEKLIKRIRTRDGKDDDHHLEKTLHSFIVPMGVRGDNPNEIKSRAHELWIVDERLAFTRRSLLTNVLMLYLPKAAPPIALTS